MLDNPEKTARLLAALKAALPFKVELVQSLVNYLRDQHVAIADQTHHDVSDVSYAGDERWHRVPYRPLGGTRSACRLPNASSSAAIYAARCGRRRLSQPSRKEAEETKYGVGRIRWRVGHGCDDFGHFHA